MHKKILPKFLLFTLVLFVSLKLFSIYAVKYVENPMKTMWEIKSSISNNFAENTFKHIIIGSSRTLALNPIDIENITKLKFINLSVASAKLPYVYYTLVRLIKSGNSIEKVYIDIPASNNMNAVLKGAFGDNFIRFFLSESELNDFSQYYPEANSIYRNTRTFGKDHVNKSLYVIVKGLVKNILGINSNNILKKQLTSNRGYMLLGAPNTTSSVEQAEKYRTIVANVTKKDVPEVQIIYLEKIINLLKQENIKYKFFFSPYPSVSKKIKNLGIGNYIHLLKRIPVKNRIDNLLILDEMFFIDGSHLNAAGSKKFSRYFVQEVLGVNLNKKFQTYALSYSANK